MKSKLHPALQRGATKALALWNSFCAWAFQPPYRGVPWIVWIYVAVACSFYSVNSPLSGHILGFDDHVRMTQVLNWVNGAGWYDRLITRANPPEGFHTIWTRIVDIPIAIVVIIAQQFVPQRAAALVASVVVPSIELALLFLVARYFARPLVGKRESRLIILFVMFTSVLNFKYTFAGFHIGEASHHAWYGILDLLLFGAAIRIALGVAGRSPIYLMGLSIGLLLAVGIEGFMLMAGVAAILALLAWHFGRPGIALRAAQGYGLGALLGLILLPMNMPPAHFLDVSFAEPSILGPILLGSAALYLAIQSLLLKSFGRKDRWTAFLAMIALASMLGGLLVLAFPQMMDGPAAALSPQEREMAWREHIEAYPLYKVAKGWIDGIGLEAPIVIAFLIGLVASFKARSPRRKIMYLGYFGIATMCGIVPQFIWRFFHYALLTACPWLLWAWQKIRKWMTKNRNYALKSLVVFVFLGPFWMLLLPAMNNNDPVMSRLVLYPAALHSTENPCDVLELSDFINQHYPPSTILAVPNWDSSQFLYYTDVVIDFVANYPSQNKFIDSKRIFETRDPDMARDVVMRHNIGLIAVCRVPLFLNARVPMNRQVFIALLQAKLPPSWLKLVDTNIGGNYLLYQVDRDELNKPTPPQ